MAFCSNCGAKLVEGAKFCQKCGSTVLGGELNNESRKQEFAGKIYKCPNCGEVLRSFLSNCPACGFELRGAKATNSVRELALKLEAIEARREVKKIRSLKDRMYGEEITKTDEQKISLIRSFSIPNTKEDLYEFIVLAESNIDIDLYDGTVLKTDARLAVSDAWKAKFEQAYQKAKIVFVGDSRLDNIEKLYAKTHKELKKTKGKVTRGVIYYFAGLGIIFIVLMGIVAPIKEKKEVNRLEAIVAQIETQLENGEYKYALMNAETLEYDGVSNDEQTRKWKIQRQYWIDKVLEEAEKNGVYLEYTPSEELDDKDNSSSKESSESGGIIQGFIDGVQSGVDSMQEDDGQ